VRRDQRLLLLDTAAPEGVVAVARDGELVAEMRLTETRRHAEQLAAAVDAVLATAGITRADLEGVVAGRGPGSFIGVRVALSAAKGFAFGLGIPLVGVLTLDALGCEPGLPDGEGAAVLDARRGELYVASATRAEGRSVMGPPAPMKPEALQARELAFVVGHLGSTGEALASALGPRLVVRTGPTGAGLLAAVPEGELADEAASVVPAYCRAPDAKLPAQR
jgi:tRNA threonylcarbamoyladenosine biosynthesis protein TsaB